MPALKPLPSPARVAANQENAERSTGPRTVAGKARSRGNAVLHGLTGQGVALPVAAEVEVAAQFAAITAELAPATAVGAYFARRVALAMVRADRAVRHEVSTLSHRVRHAAEAFDSARLAAIDAAHATLGAGGDARAARRALLGSAEGIARLDADLRALRDCLTLPQPLWTHEHAARLDACRGVAPDPILPTRARALTAALLGAVDLLTQADHAAITEAGVRPAAFAWRQLIGLIDAERTGLREDGAALDATGIAIDRAEATDRALFDPSPAAQLARRYEAAATREVRQALAQFHQAEATTTRSTASVEANPAAQAEVDGPPTVDVAPASAPVGSSADAPESDHPVPIDKPATITANSSLVNDLNAALASFGADCLNEAGAASTAVPTSALPPGPGGDRGGAKTLAGSPPSLSPQVLGEDQQDCESLGVSHTSAPLNADLARGMGPTPGNLRVVAAERCPPDGTTDGPRD